MTCTPIDLGNGVRGIVCTRGPRVPKCSVPFCTRKCTSLCDFAVVRRGRNATCDAKLCERHAKNVGPDRDLCPAHAHHQLPAQTALPGFGP